MAANPLKGESSLIAAGRTWVLKLPFSAARALKAEHGLDLLSNGSDIAQIDKFDAVVLAMLRAVQPDVTAADVDAILDDVGVKPVMTAMEPALAAFMGVPVETLRNVKPGSQ